MNYGPIYFDMVPEEIKTGNSVILVLNNCQRKVSADAPEPESEIINFLIRGEDFEFLVRNSSRINLDADVLIATGLKFGAARSYSLGKFFFDSSKEEPTSSKSSASGIDPPSPEPRNSIPWLLIWFVALVLFLVTLSVLIFKRCSPSRHNSATNYRKTPAESRGELKHSASNPSTRDTDESVSVAESF